MAMQVKPVPASLSELATDISEGMVNYAEADMSMDGNAWWIRTSTSCVRGFLTGKRRYALWISLD